MVGIHLNKNIVVDRSLATEEAIMDGFDDLFQDQRNIYLYDHFGSSDVDVICNRIQYMVKAFDVKWIILDHISILVSGLATTDERKLIDMAMTRLRTIVQELDIGLILVSHLRRPEGDRGHEDGSAVRLGQLRGSHAVAQLSDICIGLQVDPDNASGDTRRLVVLKNRFTGEVGSAGLVTFNRDTGRLIQADDNF
jgi:twinkle protein